MKTLNFDIVFKVIILISLVYSLILLIIIANNSSIGKYQNNVGERIIDTRTGKIYYYENGKISPMKEEESTLPSY